MSDTRKRYNAYTAPPTSPDAFGMKVLH